MKIITIQVSKSANMGVESRNIVVSFLIKHKPAKISLAAVGAVLVGFGFQGYSLLFVPPGGLVATGILTEVFLVYIFSVSTEEARRDILEARDEIDEMVREIRDIEREISNTRNEMHDISRNVSEAQRKVRESQQYAETAGKDAERAKREVEDMKRSFSEAARRF